ncbi:MAG: hypothetical protein GKR96_11465 [Gammaproteobacteria bacterium]|nr:hypothetical protein [Gammaproteobacteria bacterium]
MKPEDFEDLPGGCHREVWRECPKPRKQTIWCVAKKRLPSVNGLVRFWKPTTCEFCYWARLVVVGLAGSIFGFWISALILIAFAHSLFRRKTEWG